MGSGIDLELSRRSFVTGASLATLSLTAAAGGFSPLMSLAASGAPSFDRRRWWTHEYRIVQTNLREIDARQNPREIVQAIRDFGANVMVSNIGGIVAFYPTQLELQYLNPHLQGDFVGETLEASHAAGLAYIGRFDLSKGTKLAYDAHPDWFVLNRDGRPREYEGTYQACPNGGWAQQYGFEILREGLTRYAPDGLFFNMTGYPQTDYSNVWHGICVCENCRRRFHEMYKLELPKTDGYADPNWAPYIEFQRRTSAELAQKVHDFVHSLHPNTPIADAWFPKLVGRGEVQRRVHRTAPEWPYMAGEQSRAILAAHPGIAFSATSAAHIDYPWRQVTESAANHLLRFSQSLAVGAKLDLYLMGTLADQDDPTYLPPLSALYQWHAANEQHYAGLVPAARVGLHSSMSLYFGAPTPLAKYSLGAFRGAYAALVDSRLPFWMVSGDRLAERNPMIPKFDVIILPHALLLDDAEAAALDTFVSEGGLLIATGYTGGYNKQGKKRDHQALACSPIASFTSEVDARGWSLDDTHAELNCGAGRIALDGPYFKAQLRAQARNLIPFAADQRFGPPEFSYAIPGAAARSEPSVLIRAFGKGHAVHIPWLPDWQYYRDGLAAHRNLFATLIARFAPPVPWVLTGNGPVEMTAMRQPALRKTLIHVINYAGQRNTSYIDPPTLHDLRLGVRTSIADRAVALVSGRALRGRRGQDGLTWFDLPPVAAFEAIQLTEA